MHSFKRSLALLFVLFFSFGCDIETFTTNENIAPHKAEKFLQSDLDSAIYYAKEIDAGYFSKYILGYAYSRKKDYSRSLAYYLEALDLSPNDQEQTKILNNLARIAKLYKANDAAMDYYQQALKLDPDNPIILYNLANVYKATADYANAERLYKSVSAMSLDRNQITRHLKSAVQLAMVIYKQHDDGKATEILDQVINYSTETQYSKYIANAYQGKSVIAYDKGNTALAIDLLQKALSYHTDDHNRFVTLLDLGDYHLTLNSLDTAIHYLKKAEKLYDQVNPGSEYAEVFELLSKAKRKTGAINEAFDYASMHRSQLKAYIQMQEEINSRLNTRDFYQILEKHQKEKESREKMLLILAVILLLVGSIVAIVAIYRNRELKKKKAVVKSFEKFNASLKQT